MTKLFMLCFLCLAFFAEVAWGRPSSGNFYAASNKEISQPAGSLIRYQRVAMPLLYRAKAWRILYATRDFANRPIAASGYVVLPDRTPDRAEDRQIVGWAHPTTGIDRSCAPSRRQTPVAAILGLNEFVALGYTVAATDYPGLGTVGPVGYLVGKGQAQAVIDSVRAARQIPGVGGGSKYGLLGYSQGGHAVAYASLLSHEYAPEFELVGIAAIAPPSDLRSLMIADQDSLAGHVLSSFTLGSWSLKYGTPLSTLMSPETIRSIQRVNASCIDKMEGMVEIFKAQKRLGSDFLPTRSLSTPPWRNYVATNSISGLSARVPALVTQGGIDEIVRPQVTRNFVRNSCRNGARVKYVEFPGLGHGKVARASTIVAVNWLKDRLSGKPAPSSCK